MAVKVSFVFNKSPQNIAKRILSPAVKLYAATTWHKLYYPFIPFGDTGQLSSNVAFSVEGNSGIITHKVVYARRIYFGRSFKFRRDKHALASALFDQAARAAGKGEALAKSVEAFVKSQ